MSWTSAVVTSERAGSRAAAPSDRGTGGAGGDGVTMLIVDAKATQQTVTLPRTKA